MNHDLLIKTTNRVAVYATVVLIYWVFVFLAITIFDLKIFRERMTEMFFLSLLGIFAVLGGAIILNVMSNLSKISTAISPQAQTELTSPATSRWRIMVAIAIFPLLASALFIGDTLSAKRKKDLLIASAERLISENQTVLPSLADYGFSPDYVKATERSLGIFNKLDKNFPEVMVIFPDVIDGKKLFLGFGGRRYGFDEKEEFEKPAYIYSTTRDERDYLERVFAGSETQYRFHAEKGNYQLYFPTSGGGKNWFCIFQTSSAMESSGPNRVMQKPVNDLLISLS